MADAQRGFRTPASSGSAPNHNPHLTQAQDPSGADVRPFVLQAAAVDKVERFGLTAELLSAAHALASSRIGEFLSGSERASYQCLECRVKSESIPGMDHLDSCRVGYLLGLVYAIAKLPEPGPVLAEAASAEASTFTRYSGHEGPDRVVWDMTTAEAERQNLCYQFCEGIPTEDLKRELPLASPLRRRWHEIQYLRRALPFLPAVQQ